MCGDHYPGKGLSLLMMGSPPHVRGPRVFSHHLGKVFGITPACAGTTKFFLR